MDITTLNNETKVFGLQVHTFPENVGEAFDLLMKQISNGDQRSYYGISWMEGNSIVYFAAAEQRELHEASQYSAREFTIPKGKYLREVLKDWMPKVASIKDIFEKMMSDPSIDLTQPAIEWYKSDEEMWCLMKIKDA